MMLSRMTKTSPKLFALSLRPLRLCVKLLAAWVLLAATAQAQQDAKVPDPDPEIERRSFQVADGFEVNLFAADPLLAKPIQMNFDAAGRLWVACSDVYPQIKPGQKANDKIIILEDTHGDGRADKTTVFADGLLIPTGVEPGDGGAYVANSTDLLHLEDTKGTGHADRRRVVLSGFGTEDTHHILHTFRWGPDGMLYFNQSIYIHSHIETPHGVRRLGGGGVWQFRPEARSLEVFVRGFCNPWGHTFDRWGQSFVTDGAYVEGINYGLPGASYVFTPGAARILAGLNPGSPKHCGAEVLSGRHLPADWRGNILTNDFRGHRVCRFVIDEDGAGYTAREQTELIKTNHAAFRPVDVKMGPDGAMYIADWYNPIIQHGEVDFRDPRRDHTHGRIWRVTAKGRSLVKRPQLAGAGTETLLEALKAPEDWTRHHAKRVLKERGRKVLPALAVWVRKLDPNNADHEHHLLEALWSYQSLDVVEPDLLKTLLSAKDHHARAAATRVIQYWHGRLSNPMELLAPRVADEHPQVRLEAVRALARLHSPRAAELAMKALDLPMDPYVDYALWLTARELAPDWVPALRKGRMDFGGNVRQLLFALQALDSSEAVKPLVELVQAGKIAREREDDVLGLIATLGGPQELGMVFDRVVAKGATPGRQAHLVEALEQAARQRGVRPAGDLARLGQVLAANNDGLPATACRLAGLWKVEALRPRLLEYARADTTGEALRQAAVDGLALLGGKESQKALDELAGSSHPLPLRRVAVVALASVDLQAAATRAADVLVADQAAGDATSIFDAFLHRKNGAALLAAALTKRKLHPDVAKIGVRAVRTSVRQAPALVEALSKAGNLTTGPRVLSPKEMRQMVADVARHGNAARGEMVFRRKDQTCLKCHAIAGAGGQVGPDLVSIGASAQVDYLIESILQPNKAVKENYHSLLVTTKDGRFFTGIKVRQTDKELVLRNAEDQEVAVPLNSIDEQAPGGSLMPDALADTLTRGELIDLVRFLSELGKVGPYSVSKARLVRRWQVLEPTPAAWSLLTRTSFVSAASGKALTWDPAYSTVSGTLPLADLPRFRFQKPDSKEADVFGFVRCQLDASTAGRVKLVLNSARGLTCWLDANPVEAKEQMLLDVKPGVHTLTVAVNLGRRRAGLRCEVEDVPNSRARVRLIAGK
ncbi:MAG TPA: PVC-type heme-binding CxxCH protein [Gemmataceae bacterium]|nr:PVC-type heme-binding CxxCH protein [Gemmataceae bacterium]